MFAIYGIVTLGKQRIGAAEIYNMDHGNTLDYLDTILIATFSVYNSFEELLWRPGNIENPEAFFGRPIRVPSPFDITTPTGLRFTFRWKQFEPNF